MNAPRRCPCCERGQQRIQPASGTLYDCGSLYYHDHHFPRTEECVEEGRRLASEAVAAATDRVTRALWALHRRFVPCDVCHGIGQREVTEEQYQAIQEAIRAAQASRGKPVENSALPQGENSESLGEGPGVPSQVGEADLDRSTCAPPQRFVGEDGAVLLGGTPEDEEEPEEENLSFAPPQE